MKDIKSARGTIEFLKNINDIQVIKGEVDPVYEVSGITKALDGGPALLFENIKGYPNKRITSNIFSRRERIAKIFDVDDPKKLKFKYLEALRNGIPPKVVDNPPCQENVITRNIDVLNILPIIKHTEEDAGRILGGGNILLMGPDIGSHVSFNRTHFQGKDWASMAFNLGSHLEYNVLKASKKKAKLPITINICTSPAIWATAGAGFLSISLPAGDNELDVAGGLQGAPIEICRAKTVDAYALAGSEWVIEGYIDTNETVWESEEAKKLGKIGKAPFFPEYPGYMGRAYKTFKFQATAITHRGNPILYAPLAHSIETNNICGLFGEASLYDVCNRIHPGFVVDVNILDAFKSCTGAIIQVKKRRRRDEGYQRNVILAAFTALSYLRIVVVVDDDVDIYNTDDILWALTSRVEPTRDIIVVSGSRGDPTSPGGRAVEKEEYHGVAGKRGYDATVPYSLKWLFTRAKHPAVDLKKWLSEEEINNARALQSEYAKLMARLRS